MDIKLKDQQKKPQSENCVQKASLADIVSGKGTTNASIKPDSVTITSKSRKGPKEAIQ